MFSDIDIEHTFVSISLLLSCLGLITTTSESSSPIQSSFSCAVVSGRVYVKLKA